MRLSTCSHQRNVSPSLLVRLANDTNLRHWSFWIDPHGADKQQQRKPDVAAMRGESYRGLAKLLKRSASSVALDVEASKLNDSDYAHHADRADAVMKILPSENGNPAPRKIGREEKAAPIPNLWL